jgi:hypothetical protein
MRRRYPMKRKTMRRSAVLASLLAGCSSDPQALTDRVICEATVVDAPFPPSSVIRGLDIDFSTHRREAQESDNWPLTWADDDHQYTSWGDGTGFNGNVPEKVGLGYSRIEGGPSSYAGQDVFYGVTQGSDDPFRGKSYGILSLPGRLYSWISPGSDQRNWAWARLFVSTDDGRTWEDVGVEFTQDEGLGLPWFLQAGRSYGAAEDGFVYIYFVEVKDGEWEAQRPGELALARVPIAEIEDRDAYEFFAGRNGGGGAVWTSDLAGRRPVIEDPNGLMRGSTIYNPGLDRYLTVINHTARNLGNLAIFDAPTPWGPWTSVLYVRGWSGPGVAADTFYWNFSPKWLSPDGRTFVLVFSGKGENDSWNSVEGSFLLCADGP